MKLLKLHTEADAIRLTRLSDLSPFNDNGAAPDGNAYLIPIDECPAEVRENPSTFGEIVEGQRVEYEEDEAGAFPSFAGAWMGLQFDGFAYVAA